MRGVSRRFLEKSFFKEKILFWNHGYAVPHDHSNLHNLLCVLVEYCGFISRILFFVFCVTIHIVISIKRFFDDIMEDINMYLVEFTTLTNPTEVSYEFGSIDDVKTFLEKNRELLQSYVVVHKNGNIVKI